MSKIYYNIEGDDITFVKILKELPTSTKVLKYKLPIDGLTMILLHEDKITIGKYIDGIMGELGKENIEYYKNDFLNPIHNMSILNSKPNKDVVEEKTFNNPSTYIDTINNEIFNSLIIKSYHYLYHRSIGYSIPLVDHMYYLGGNIKDNHIIATKIDELIRNHRVTHYHGVNVMSNIVKLDMGEYTRKFTTLGYEYIISNLCAYNLSLNELIKKSLDEVHSYVISLEDLARQVLDELLKEGNISLDFFDVKKYNINNIIMNL